MKEFQPIEKKLKTGEYDKYFDFERDLNLFFQFLLEHGPNTVNRRLIFLEFFQKRLADGALYFVRTLHQDLDISKSVQQEFQQKYENEIKEVKAEFNRERQSFIGKITEIEQTKFEIEKRETKLRENNEELKKLKDSFENQLKDQLQKERGETSQVVADMKNKIEQYEEKIKENDRKLILRESEFQKEKALLEQRVEYYEKNLSEYKEKEKVNGLKNSNPLKTLSQ